MPFRLMNGTQTALINLRVTTGTRDTVPLRSLEKRAICWLELVHFAYVNVALFLFDVC